MRLVTSPGKLDVDALIDAVDADGLFWTQTAGPRREHAGRRDDAARRRAAAAPSSSATCDFLISPEAFFQTNTEMAERLYGARAPSTPALRGHERVFDLYCGIGTIGALARRRARAR